MHDTDRILAELSALDELEPETGTEELEDFEGLEEMEFEPEAGLDEEEYGDTELGDSEYGDGELEPEGEFEGEGGQDFEGGLDFEGPDFEGEDELEGEPVSVAAAGAPLNETDEMELAAELLEVQDEGELEYFLGGLIGKVVRKLGAALDTPLGKQLTGILKTAAQKALPIAGTALGTAIGGPAGAAIASDLTSRAGQLFGLELEGLTREDQEFEAARSFVRFAAEAAQEAAAAGPMPNAAHAAVATAASRHAPGLLAAGLLGPGMVVRRRRRRGMTGRWVRVSRNQILLYGL